MAIALLLLTAGQPINSRVAGIPRVAWVVIGVATIPWLQLISGLLVFSGDAWISSLYLLGFATAISTGYMWGRSNESDLAIPLAMAALVAASISSALGFQQVVNEGGLGIWMHDAVPGMRAEANLAQPNNLSTLIGFGLIGLLLLREKGFLGIGSSIGLLILLIGGAGLTQSRTGLLFGPVICFCLYLYSRRHPGQLRTRVSHVALITVSHWLIVWSWPALEDALLLIPPVSLSDRGFQDIRVEVWRMFVGALNQAPWFGYGWLQTATAQFSVAEQFQPLKAVFLQTHNLFLELPIWCGYPLGLLLDGSIVYWFITRLWRVSTMESLCGFLVVAVLAVHSMLELPYHYAYFLIPAGLWIGAIESSIGSQGYLLFRSNLMLAMFSFCLLLAIWRDYFSVEEDFRLVRFELLHVGTLHAAQPAPRAPFLSTLTAQLRFYRTPPAVGMSDADLADMAALIKRYPFSDSLYRYSLALALNGRVDEARQVFLKIRHIQGEVIYRSFKNDLQQKIVEGEVGLLSLGQSLPL